MNAVSTSSSSFSVPLLTTKNNVTAKTAAKPTNNNTATPTTSISPDALTLTAPAKPTVNSSVQFGAATPAVPTATAAATAADNLIAQLETTKALVTKFNPPTPVDEKAAKAAVDAEKAAAEAAAKAAKDAANAEKILLEQSKKSNENVTVLDPPNPIEPTPALSPTPAPVPALVQINPAGDSTSTVPPTTAPTTPPDVVLTKPIANEPSKPADPTVSGGSIVDSLKSTSGASQAFVLVKVRGSKATVTNSDDLSTKYDALQAQFKELNSKVADLNAVSDKLEKLTSRFEGLIKLMFHGSGSGGLGGNLNLANINSALAVARLSKNVALGFGGNGSNGGGAFNGLLQNLSGIGGFVQSQNLLLQNKGLDGTLRSVSQLKQSFESQLASLSDQIQELGSRLDAKA